MIDVTTAGLTIFAVVLAAVAFLVGDRYAQASSATHPAADPWGTGQAYDRVMYAELFCKSRRYGLVSDACKWAASILGIAVAAFGIRWIGGFGWAFIGVGVIAIAVAAYPFVMLPQRIRQLDLDEKFMRIGPWTMGYNITVNDI